MLRFEKEAVGAGVGDVAALREGAGPLREDSAGRDCIIVS